MSENIKRILLIGALIIYLVSMGLAIRVVLSGSDNNQNIINPTTTVLSDLYEKNNKYISMVYAMVIWKIIIKSMFTFVSGWDWVEAFFKARSR